MSKTIKCKNCGEKISAKAKKCPYCEAEIKKPKKNRLLKTFVILIWIILILAIIASALWGIYTFAFRVYDCKELLKVNFDGSNKSAIGYVKLNEENSLFSATETGEDNTPILTDVYDTDLENAKEIQALLRDSIYVADDPRDETYKTVVDGIIHMGTTLSKREGIKNGDIITVDVSYDKWALLKNGIRLENTEFDVKVTGLTYSSTIDPFSGIKYIFTGVDDFGKVTLDTSKCSDIVADNFEYTVSPNANLSEGDKITVIAKYTGKSYDDNSGTFEYGGKYYSSSKESRKDITVSSLNSAQTLDPFENVTVDYEGIDPFLKVSGYDTSQADKVISTYFDFEASKSENLKAGEVITVKAVYKTVDEKQYTDKDLESAGYVLLKNERTYTVPDSVAKYAKKSTGFNVNRISESFSASLAPYKKDKNKVRLVKSYFGLRKNNKTALPYNKYYEVYEITVGKNKKYMAFSAENIFTDSTGNLKFTPSVNGDASPNMEAIKSKFIDSDNSNYKISEAEAPKSPVNNYNITTTATTTKTTKKAAAAKSNSSTTTAKEQ